MDFYSPRLDRKRKEIRTLTLKAGSDASQIRCSMSVVSLDDIPTYEALSYAWGQASNPKQIEVNNRPIFVTSNLHSALSHLRHTTIDRDLWVDAVCINQKDTLERNAQVSIMGDIYRLAQSVLIWLGEADEHSDLAFESMPYVDVNFLQSETAALVWSFYINATHRPYMSRIWVIQEFVLATSDPVVYCGHKQISWSIFMAVYKKLASEFFTKLDMVKNDPQGGPPEVLAKLRHDLFHELRISVAQDQGADLRQLLIMSRSAEASEPRDRIYSLLGMLDSEDRKHFEVDYKKSTAHVFAEAMALIFSHGDGPRFLSGMWCPSKPNHLVPNLPSWVPDFTSQTAEKAAPFLCNMSFNPPFPRSASGAGSDAKNGTVMQDFSTLRVEALPIDVIEDVMILGNTTDECISQLKEIQERAFLARKRDIPNENIRSSYCKYRAAEPLWRTLISNKVSGYDPAPTAFESAFETLLLTKNFSNQMTQESSTLSDYRQVLSNHLPRRTFVTTRNGLYGLGTADVRPGDAVTIWFGANTPFITRSRQNDPSKCILVGAAYIAGIMNGEAVDELYCEDLLDSVTLYVT